MKKLLLAAAGLAILTGSSHAEKNSLVCKTSQLKVVAHNRSSETVVPVAESVEIGGSNGMVAAANSKVTLLPNYNPGSPTTFVLHGYVFSDPAKSPQVMVAQCQTSVTLRRPCAPRGTVAVLTVTEKKKKGWDCSLVPTFRGDADDETDAQ